MFTYDKRLNHLQLNQPITKVKGSFVCTTRALCDQSFLNVSFWIWG
jgi:hypothetical protein